MPVFPIYVTNTDTPSLSPTTTVESKFEELEEDSMFGMGRNKFLGIIAFLWVCSLICCYLFMRRSSYEKGEVVEMEIVAAKDVKAITRWPSLHSESGLYAESSLEVETPAFVTVDGEETVNELTE